MSNQLMLLFESAMRVLHQSLDPVPERTFHLMSGLLLIAVGLRMRRTFE